MDTYSTQLEHCKRTKFLRTNSPLRTRLSVQPLKGASATPKDPHQASMRLTRAATGVAATKPLPTPFVSPFAAFLSRTARRGCEPILSGTVCIRPLVCMARDSRGRVHDNRFPYRLRETWKTIPPKMRWNCDLSEAFINSIVCVAAGFNDTEMEVGQMLLKKAFSE